MLIINEKQNVNGCYISVKIENFNKSNLIKKMDKDMKIIDLIDFLENLDFDLRSKASISIFKDTKILILRS